MRSSLDLVRWILLFLGCAVLNSACRPPRSVLIDEYGIDPVILTDADFDEIVLRSPVPVVVDFWAPWCEPCLRMAPAIRELAEKFEGRAVVAKLNVDENFAAARRYQIDGLPTLLFFKDGQVVHQLSGAQTLPDLSRRLEDLLRDGSAT